MTSRQNESCLIVLCVDRHGPALRQQNQHGGRMKTGRRITPWR